MSNISTTLSKVKNGYKQDGVSYLWKKLFFRIRYYFLRFINPNFENQRRWKELKGRFRGKRVFLIGNGPSLNKTPLYLLKNEYTMCFNRFYIMTERLNWSPKFYMSVDNLVLSDLIEEIESILSSPQTLLAFFPDIHKAGSNFKESIKYKDERIYWVAQVFGLGFSKRLPKVKTGATVIYEGLQVLNYLGFDEIYLVGVDMSFNIHKTAKELKENDKEATDIVSQKDDDPNHFDPRYFGKGRKYHQPEKHAINNVIKILDDLGQKSEELGLKIINSGYDSKLESFPKINFRSLFNYSEEEELQLFRECLNKGKNSITVNLFQEKFPMINSESDIESNLGNFWSSMDLSLKIISKVVFTHIPVGPFKGNYYFLERKKKLSKV